MGLFVLVLFCLMSLTCYGYSSNKHMICKDVGDVFADVTNSGPHSRRLIGPSGKKGSKGEMGFHGADGQPGTVDYDKVQEIVRLKVEEETRLLQVKVDEMRKEIHNLTSQISVVSCVGGVIHEGICYWAEFDTSKYGSTDYAEAEKICSNKRSRLADIYGKVHYDLIMSYLRGKLDRLSAIWVWTGMKKIYRNNIAQLSNGSPAPYTRKRSGSANWDGAESRRTRVYLLIRSSTNNSDQGMGAYITTGYLHGALCQTE